MKDELNWNPKKTLGFRKMTWFLHLGRSGVGIFVGRGNHPTNQSTNQPNVFFSTCSDSDSDSTHWQPRFLPPLTAKPLKKTRPRQKKNSYLEICKKTSNQNWKAKNLKISSRTTPNLPSRWRKFVPSNLCKWPSFANLCFPFTILTRGNLMEIHIIYHP